MLAIELMKLAYALSPTRIAVLSDVGRTPFLEEELRRGTECSIPRWLAEILRDLGKAEPSDEGPVYSKILKVKFAHTSDLRQGLPQVSEFFYIHSISELNRELSVAQNRMDLDLLTKVNRAVKAFSDVASRRLSYIIKAISLGGYTAIERSLSYEEKLLALILSRVINEWKDSFANLGNTAR